MLIVMETLPHCIVGQHLQTWITKQHERPKESISSGTCDPVCSGQDICSLATIVQLLVHRNQ